MISHGFISFFVMTKTSDTHFAPCISQVHIIKTQSNNLKNDAPPELLAGKPRNFLLRH